MRDGAVIDATHRPGQRALPPFGGIELGPQPGDRRRIPRRARQLTAQPRGLVLRCAQRVAHALQLGAVARRQVACLSGQAVGTRGQRHQVVRAVPAVPLHPGESCAGDKQQDDEDLRGTA